MLFGKFMKQEYGSAQNADKELSEKIEDTLFTELGSSTVSLF